MRSGGLVHRVQSLHEMHGSVVRLAPNEVSFTDPQACRDIYAYRSGHHPFPKNQVWVPTPPKDSGKAPSILNADDEDHARIRKAWSYGFSDKALKDQEPLITSHVDKLISRLRQQCDSQARGAILDIVKWYNFCVFDIIGDLAFGEPFGCLDHQEYHSWIATIVHHFKAAVLMSACRYYPLLYKWLVWSVPKSSIQKQAQHFAMAGEKVQSRLSKEKEHPDFLSHLTKAKAGLSDAEIVSTAGIIIIAGSNSLTTTLAGTTNYLLRFPEALAKVTQEIRSTYNNEADMNLTNLGKLSYLTAVIEEGLRIIAPVPLGMPRIVPKGGDTVCGEWLPEDVSLFFLNRGHNSDASVFRPVCHSCSLVPAAPSRILLSQMNSSLNAGLMLTKIHPLLLQKIKQMLRNHSRWVHALALARNLPTLNYVLFWLVCSSISILTYRTAPNLASYGQIKRRMLPG